ncbi:MAG TPA: hypothetical protein VMR06_10570 [Dokdonella sp.]|uniref:hypothetical protein n=1 Tax=Dokdonella sp. TaxID=2291710 RepID=UPI002BEFAA61|nr:hypothetical protein [Dokdonella sp.]HUD42423.1 hypothetical protein [Dokdonella sp.]
MRSAPAIAFDYQPSRLLIAALASMLALALVSINVSGLDWAWKVGLSAIALGACVRSLHHWAHPRWTRIAFGEAGWVLADRAGSEAAAALDRYTKLGAMQVLTLRAESQAFHVVILPDNLQPDLRRRLVLVVASQPSSPELGSPRRLQ